MEADEKEQTDAIYQKHWDEYKNKNKKVLDQYVKEFQKSGYTKEEAEEASNKVLIDDWLFTDDWWKYSNEVEKVWDDTYTAKKEINKYCKDVMGVTPFNSKNSRDAAIGGTAITLATLGLVGAGIIGYGLVST